MSPEDSGFSTGPMTLPDSAFPVQAFKENVADIPSAVAIAVFAAVESGALWVTFFFSIFIKKFPPLP